MKIRLIVELEMPEGTDWPNTRLAALQQSVNECNALADHLELNAEAGERITDVRAQLIDAPGCETVTELLGGNYKAWGLGRGAPCEDAAQPHKPGSTR